MLCGQYDILYASLKNINKSMSESDMKALHLFKERQAKYKFDEQELNQYFISTEKLDNTADAVAATSLEDALIDCVKHHQMILEFSRLLQDFFSWFVFSKLIYSGEHFTDFSSQKRLTRVILLKLFFCAFWLTSCQQWKSFPFSKSEAS